MAKDRHECDAGIPSHAEDEPRDYDVEDCAVDVEQEHRETGKEEEKGEMDKDGHRSLLGAGTACRVPLRGKYEFELGRVDNVVPLAVARR